MDDFRSLWLQLYNIIKTKTSETAFDVFFKTFPDAYFEEDVIRIPVSSSFIMSSLEKNFSDIIDESIIDVFGIPLEYDYVLISDQPADDSYPQTQPQGNGSISDAISDNEKVITGSDKYTFENFVVGESNKLAYEAALSIASKPLGSVYNPFFIYGNSGVGKTHLLCAIRNELLRKNPSLNILYTTTENFLNMFFYHISHKDQHAFRNVYRTVDALFIDDIQFLEKHNTLQSEFFHTFNDLNNSGKEIIISSDRPAKELQGITDRIRTRFEGGLIAEILPPDFDTRVAIIHRKCSEINLSLNSQITNYIADSVKDNVRQIEGTITRISAVAAMNGCIPSMNEIQKIVQSIVTNDRPLNALTEDIIQNVAEIYGVSTSDIKSENRSSNIKEARDVSMYIIKFVTSISLIRIGEIFNKKHSTVHHSIEKVSNMMEIDDNFKMKINNIIKQFQN